MSKDDKVDTVFYEEQRDPEMLVYTSPSCGSQPKFSMITFVKSRAITKAVKKKTSAQIYLNGKDDRCFS